jgi:molybdopterin synthase sulfur carrier subunit
MAVRLVFLGRLEDIAGAAELSVAAGLLADILLSLDPALMSARIKLALNGTIIGDSAGLMLADGDELAFLPPVSGG